MPSPIHPPLGDFTNAIINYKHKSMRLTIGDIIKEVNIFNLGKQPQDLDDQAFEMNLIKYLTSEHGEEIELETECEFELEFENYKLD